MTESVHSLSGAYVVDALDDAERELFERHLPGCLDCQHEVSSLREGAAVMADAVATLPPAHLRDAVLAGIRTIRPLPPEHPGSTDSHHPEEVGGTAVPMRRRRPFRVGRLVAAAAVAAAVGTGVVWHPWEPQTSTTLSTADRVLGASDVRHVSINLPDGTTATVFRSASEKRAVLVARRMAAPPAGKAFELWLQGSSGPMVPAGLMTKSGDQKVLLHGDASQAVRVGITVEPEGGSDAPTSDPIAVFELSKAEA